MYLNKNSIEDSCKIEKLDFTSCKRHIVDKWELSLIYIERESSSVLFQLTIFCYDEET